MQTMYRYLILWCVRETYQALFDLEKNVTQIFDRLSVLKNISVLKKNNSFFFFVNLIKTQTNVQAALHSVDLFRSKRPKLSYTPQGAECYFGGRISAGVRSGARKIDNLTENGGSITTLPGAADAINVPNRRRQTFNILTVVVSYLYGFSTNSRPLGGAVDFLLQSLYQG